jgi:hypothetical protein
MHRIGRLVVPIAVLITTAWAAAACGPGPAAPAAPIRPLASRVPARPSGDTVRPWMPAGVLLVAALVVAAIAIIAYAARRTPAPSPGAGPWQAPTLEGALREVAGSGASQAVTQQIERLMAEPPGRDALVQACIRYRDLLAERHPALAETLSAALQASGVRETTAEGQLFDGRLHEAVDVQPTADPRLHDRVARTVRWGYADGDRVLRVPQVIVYRLSPEEP